MEPLQVNSLIILYYFNFMRFHFQFNTINFIYLFNLNYSIKKFNYFDPFTSYNLLFIHNHLCEFEEYLKHLKKMKGAIVYFRNYYSILIMLLLISFNNNFIES
jgi:dolichol kinase